MAKRNRFANGPGLSPSGKLAVGSLVVAALCFTACDESGEAGKRPPVNGTQLAENVRVLESNTQMQLDGVAIGAGNFWEEDYFQSDGTRQKGLTAALFITVTGDPAKNQNLRVHPGEELDLPGYHITVVAVEARRAALQIDERPN
jgi:hypothetical protein